MKIYALFLSAAIVLIFSSCGKEDEKYQEPEYIAKIRELEKKELATKAVNNEIFLGLKFGMTQNEVNQYLLNLYNEGKIRKKNYSDYYFYDLKFADEINNAEIKIYPEYNYDRLYVLLLEVSPVISGMLFGKSNLGYLYAKKYGPIDYSWTEKDKNSAATDHDIWVDGNRKIEIIYEKDKAEVRYSNIFVFYNEEPDTVQAKIMREATEKASKDL